MIEAGKSERFVSAALKIARGTLASWIERGEWVKGKIEPKLVQSAEEALEAEAQRFGVTKARILAKVGELLDAKSIAAVTTQGAISLCPLPPESKAKMGGKADVAGISADVVPDRATQIAAAKMGIDVLGMKKVEVDAGEGFRDFFSSLKAHA